jgi:hypothetical protein
MKHKTVEQDVDKEIRFHLEERTRELVAQGMEPERARAEASRVFGNERRIRSECRDITRTMRRERGLSRMIDSLWQDLRFALKTLRHAPVFAAVAVLTLALGIGANTAIFSVVNGVLLAPLPYPDADRLVRIWESSGGGGDVHVAWANYLDWRAAESLESLALHPSFAFGGASTVIGGDQPTRVLVAAVTRDFFRTLGVTAELGRVPSADEHAVGAAAVAVVSHDFWQSQLGAAAELGERTLKVGATSSASCPPASATRWTPTSGSPPNASSRVCRARLTTSP